MRKSVSEGVLGVALSPLNQRRLRNFRNNRRASVSAWVFLAIFVFTLPAEFIANDKPLLVGYDGAIFVPVLITYPETVYGGEFETEAEYRELDVQDLIRAKDGWMLWPLIPFSYRTVNYDLKVPAPSPPRTSQPSARPASAPDVAALAHRCAEELGETLIFTSEAFDHGADHPQLKRTDGPTYDNTSLRSRIRTWTVTAWPIWPSVHTGMLPAAVAVVRCMCC